MVVVCVGIVRSRMSGHWGDICTRELTTRGDYPFDEEELYKRNRQAIDQRGIAGYRGARIGMT